MTEPVFMATPAQKPWLQTVFEESWDTFKRDALVYVLMSLIGIVLAVVSIGVLAGPLTVGMIRAVRDGRRGQTVELGALFSGTSSFASSALCMLLVVAAGAIASLLLVLPGMLVFMFCSFALHEIAYRNVGVKAAISASFELVKRSFAQVLLLLIAIGIVNALGSAVVFGTLLAIPFSAIALTVAYEKLRDATA